MSGGLVQCLGQFFRQNIDLGGAANQGGCHDHGVSRLAHHQAARVGLVAAEDRGFRVRCQALPGALVAHQFDRGEHAQPSDLTDNRVILQFPQAGLEVRRHLAGGLLDNVTALQNVECGEAARDLIRDACLHEGIEPGMLTIHADNGAAPTAMPVVNLFDRLGVTESRIRPHVSNDNCFSESLFRTCKYRPGYPDRFPAFAEAYTWCESFFDWYNLEHRHSGIAYLTPVVVHSGQAHAVITRRAAVLSAAYDRHPERFVSGPPSPPELPTAVYINPPRLMLENEQLQ